MPVVSVTDQGPFTIVAVKPYPQETAIAMAIRQMPLAFVAATAPRIPMRTAFVMTRTPVWDLLMLWENAMAIAPQTQTTMTSVMM